MTVKTEKKDGKREYKRILKFGVVGLTGIFVNEGLLWFFTEIVGLFYLFSGIIAVEASIISNFIFNDIWTFKDMRNGTFMNRMLKFNVARWLIIVVNLGILLGLTMLGMHYLIANLIGIIAATALTYTSSLKWVWK